MFSMLPGLILNQVFNVEFLNILFEYIQDNIKITSQKDRKKISQETVSYE